MDKQTISIEPRELPNTLALLGRAGFKRAIDTQEPKLPETVMQCRGMVIPGQKLAKFNELTSWQRHQHLPPTFIHLLAFPLQMSLVLEEAFPFALMGLIHIENMVQQLRPVYVNETLNLTCYLSDLMSHRRGWQFKMNTEAYVGQEMVWRSTSTSLVKQSSAVTNDKPPHIAKVASPKGLVEEWNLPTSLGRSYAKVSGDFNPIHLYALTAKLLGFERHIVHGMWSKARVMSALSNNLPDTYEVKVKFKRPVLLPTQVVFSNQPDESDGRFTLYSQSLTQQHLSGNWKTLGNV
jgi:acyl dehydratase